MTTAISTKENMYQTSTRILKNNTMNQNSFESITYGISDHTLSESNQDEGNVISKSNSINDNKEVNFHTEQVTQQLTKNNDINIFDNNTGNDSMDRNDNSQTDCMTNILLKDYIPE